VAFFGNPLRYDRETKFYKYSFGLRNIDIKHLELRKVANADLDDFI